MQVLVRDNNVDQALRVLKKKMQREGVFREMKQRKAYEKPSERKTRIIKPPSPSCSKDNLTAPFHSCRGFWIALPMTSRLAT